MALSLLTHRIHRPVWLPLAIVLSLASGSTALYAQTKASKASDAIRQPEGQGVETTADSMDFDQKTNMIVARGHVVMTYGKIKLYADQAQINTETKQAHARGNVHLRHGYREWNLEELDYNFATGAMKAGRGRAQLDEHVYVQGDSMESEDKKRFILKNSYLTTSDYDQPGWRLRCGTVVAYPGNRLSLRHMVIYAGDIPLFYFPYMVVPLDDWDISSGTQVQIGSKSNWGFFVLNSYTTRISEDVRPTYRLDYRTNRGLAGGLDLRYKADAGDSQDAETPGERPHPRVSGKIKGYYADDKKIRDSGPVEVVKSAGTVTEQIPPDRYQVRITQRADLNEEISSKLKINKLSDANFLEDFFEKEFQKDPQPDNFLEITKWSPNTTFSLMGRPQFNDFFTTTERLPEARFELKRQPIFGSPLFYESENSAARLYRKFAHSPVFEDYHTTRADSFHQILYPKQYFGWLNVTPRVGGRATFYDRSRFSSTEPSLVRGVWNAGVDTSFKASRTWADVADKHWEINGLRHIIEPSVNYGFVSRPTRRPSELLQFDVDRSSFGVNRDLVPIDFPQYTGIDSIDKRNVFRPTMRQRLQTRRDGSSWDLAELLIYQDILADKTDDESMFSDLFGEFTTKPVRWLSLGWVGRYDYDGDRLRESTTTASVFRGKTWKIDASHSYFRGVGDHLGVGYAWALNENWTFRSTHRLDASTGTLFEQAYAVDRDLHAWILTLSVSQLRPVARDTDLRIWLSMTLKAFPEISVDSRNIGGSEVGGGGPK